MSAKSYKKAPKSWFTPARRAYFERRQREKAGEDARQKQDSGNKRTRKSNGIAPVRYAKPKLIFAGTSGRYGVPKYVAVRGHRHMIEGDKVLRTPGGLAPVKYKKPEMVYAGVDGRTGAPRHAKTIGHYYIL